MGKHQTHKLTAAARSETISRRGARAAKYQVRPLTPTLTVELHATAKGW